MKKSRWILMLVALLFVLGACSDSGGDSNKASGEGDGASGDKMTFKMHTNVPDSHLFTKTAEKFKEELESRSDGKLEVELFPNSQLGETGEIMQMLETGTLDFALFPSAFLTSDYPELNAWYMPFLFTDTEEAIEMRKIDTSKELLELFESNGIMGIDWLFSSNHSILMKDGKIDSPDDLKGKTVRSPGVEVLEDYYSAMGAGTESLPISELYQALQTGVVDGIDASADSIMSQKLFEVANDFTLLNQSALNGPGLMSMMTFEKLDDEQADIVIESMEAAIEWGNSQVLEELAINTEELKDTDVSIHEVSNMEPFYELKDELYDKYTGEHPLIKQFVDEVESLK